MYSAIKCGKESVLAMHPAMKKEGKSFIHVF